MKQTDYEMMISQLVFAIFANYETGKIIYRIL
jgi:hypothetical protein